MPVPQELAELPRRQGIDFRAALANSDGFRDDFQWLILPQPWRQRHELIIQKTMFLAKLNLWEATTTTVPKTQLVDRELDIKKFEYSVQLHLSLTLRKFLINCSQTCFHVTKISIWNNPHWIFTVKEAWTTKKGPTTPSKGRWFELSKAIEIVNFKCNGTPPQIEIFHLDLNPQEICSSKQFHVVPSVLKTERFGTQGHKNTESLYGLAEDLYHLCNSSFVQGSPLGFPRVDQKYPKILEVLGSPAHSTFDGIQQGPLLQLSFKGGS